MRVSSSAPAAAVHRVAPGVEHEVGEAQHAALLAVARAPQQRAHAREQLLERERLDQVVVRAGVEPAHAVGHRVARGEHQHRRAVAGGAQAAADLEPVDVRHQHVEHQRVGRRGGDRVERRAAVLGQLGAVAVEPQRAVDRLADRGLVVDHEDAHRVRWSCAKLKGR